MGKSILGISGQSIYRPGTPQKSNAVRCGTPDPTKYHDSSHVSLEGGHQQTLAQMLPWNHGYGGLRGTIVPRATHLGGSRGHNPHNPATIHIDPELIGGGGIEVDLAEIDQATMEQAFMEEFNAGYDDPAEAMTASFARFSKTGVSAGVKESSIAPQVLNSAVDRPPPLQMPGTYVVPKATRGGAQANPATFKKPAPAQPKQPVRSVMTQGRVDQAAPVEPVVSQPVPEQPSLQQPPPQQQTLASQFEEPPAQSLMKQFEKRAVNPETFKPMRMVTFEMKGPMGRFQVRYHDVVDAGESLVLIYDHANPTQMVWFPSNSVDSNESPVQLAALVHSDGNSPEMLYMVYPTPVNFMYDNKQFCVLLVEKRKNMSNPRGE